MKSPPVSNVKIEFSFTGGSTCLSWDSGEFHYHVWSAPENDAPWEVNDGTVFKRSFVTKQGQQPRVIKTDATSGPNRAMLAAVGHIALSTGVLNAARLALAESEAERARDLARRHRIQRLREDDVYREQALAKMERDGDHFCRAIATAWFNAPKEYRAHMAQGFAGLLEQFIPTCTEAP